MIKNNQKRYEYNTNHINSNEKDRYKHKYSNNVLVNDYPISSTTPIHQKGYAGQRQKINSSMTSTNQYYQQNYRQDQENYQPRKRINSASNVKRNQDKLSVGKKNRNIAFQENFKNTKKVYFGDSYNDEFEPTYNHQKPTTKHTVRDEKRLPNRQSQSNVLQQNCSHLNNKNERNRDYLHYRNQIKGYQASVEVNQKQIFDKIGRINRINEEINSRLAKMLNKIDNA